MSTIVVSAPGKVLMTGGYTILDRDYCGIVISTSSRFYTVLQTEGAEPYTISVRSPQFIGGNWKYKVTVPDEGSIVVEQIDEGPDATKNKFVETALLRVLHVVQEVDKEQFEHIELYRDPRPPVLKDKLALGLNITILGGNDFYSQRAHLEERGLQLSNASLNQLPPFLSYDTTLAKVHKTGLGSSAALTTSLVAALMYHFELFTTEVFDSPKPFPLEKRFLHNMSQWVHCIAQGKIGSGFDVSAAIFGTQIYSRFAAKVIEPIMDWPPPVKVYPIVDPFNLKWDLEVEYFKLPAYTRIMLADIEGGSDTPSMAGKMLKWREENKVMADVYWFMLRDINGALSKGLEALGEYAEKHAADYKTIVDILIDLPPAEWKNVPPRPILERYQDIILKMWIRCHKLTQDLRAQLREMGADVGIPIEPPEQTRLIDACIQQKGVIGGGVPGAGGYDAQWVLVFDIPGKESVVERIEQNVWANWTDARVSPLGATANSGKGVRLEKVEDVPGLKEYLQ